jgi:CheY-like chemotaxis protein
MTSGVLVVDDDAAFRAIARRLLQGAGLVVLGEAATVAAALAAVAELDPSALLLDVGLPDGDGITLATQLAGGPSVLLTSADPEAVDAVALARCGARAFIAKADLPGAALGTLLAEP